MYKEARCGGTFVIPVKCSYKHVETWTAGISYSFTHASNRFKQFKCVEAVTSPANVCAATTPALVAFLIDNCQSHDPEILCRLQLHNWPSVRLQSTSWELAGDTPQPVRDALSSRKPKPIASSCLQLFTCLVNLNLLKQKEPVKRGKVIIYKFLLLILIPMYLKRQHICFRTSGNGRRCEISLWVTQSVKTKKAVTAFVSTLANPTVPKPETTGQTTSLTVTLSFTE